MHRTHHTPPFWRVLVGFLVAPTVAAAVFVGLAAGWAVLARGRAVDVYYVELLGAGLGVSALFGTLQAFLLGLPLYLLLEHRMRLTAVRCGLTGAAVAAAPFALPHLVDLIQKGLVRPGWSSSMYVRHYSPLGVLVVAGSAAGVVFWLIVATRLTPGLEKQASHQAGPGLPEP